MKLKLRSFRHSCHDISNLLLIHACKLETLLRRTILTAHSLIPPVPKPLSINITFSAHNLSLICLGLYATHIIFLNSSKVVPSDGARKQWMQQKLHCILMAVRYSITFYH